MIEMKKRNVKRKFTEHRFRMKSCINLNGQFLLYSKYSFHDYFFFFFAQLPIRIVCFSPNVRYVCLCWWSVENIRLVMEIACFNRLHCLLPKSNQQTTKLQQSSELHSPCATLMYLRTLWLCAITNVSCFKQLLILTLLVRVQCVWFFFSDYALLSCRLYVPVNTVLDWRFPNIGISVIKFQARVVLPFFFLLLSCEYCIQQTNYTAKGYFTHVYVYVSQ